VALTVKNRPLSAPSNAHGSSLWRLLIRRSVVERVCAIARNARWVVVSSVTHLAGGGGPQRILLNLARRRVRERREVDALGYLEPGQRCAQKVLQFVCGDVHSGASCHKRNRHLASPLVGHSDHSRLDDGGVAVEYSLNLHRGDVLSAGDDDVFETIADLHIAVGVFDS
jgi:hypothetical protein